MKMKEGNNWKRIIYFEGISFFLCFMFSVFAPFEIYLSSKENFFYEGYELIGYFGLLFTAGFVLLTFGNLISCIISKRLHSTLYWLLLSLALAFYIQGNFLIVDYGLLDGSSIDWQDFRSEGIISCIIWMVVFFMTFLCWRRIKELQFMKTGAILCCCIVLIQIITLGTLLLQKGGLGKDARFVSTTEGEFTYSAEENIIVILLDTMDGKVISDLINEEFCQSTLENFTFFPDTSSLYSNTRFSVPQLLSGVEVEDGQKYEDFVREAFSADSFCKELKENNWVCNAYTDVDIGKCPDMVFDNIKEYKLTVSSHRTMGRYMTKLIGFRYMPQYLKQYFWFYSDDMNTMQSIKANGNEKIFTWSNLDFYESMENINVDSEKNVFSFYHLEGTHVPHSLKRDLTTSDTEVDINEEGRAMLTILDKFFNTLKEKRIYDNCVIVVMADHGYYDYRPNVTFLVKGMNEKHPLAIDDRTVSYRNLQEIFLNLYKGMSSEQAVISSGLTQRVFFDIDGDELREMYIEGFAGDTNNLHYTEKKIFVE